MKKPLIGSVSRTGRKSCASRMPPSDSRWRQRLTRPAEVAASDVTAADGEVVLAAREGRQHVRQLRLVVLQVAVDHRHELG